MKNCTKGQGSQVCLYINMHIDCNLNNLNMSWYHSTLRLLCNALKTRKEKMSLTIFTDWQGHLFSCPGQLQRKKTNECQMEKFPDHFATSSQNPSQPFGGMYEIKFVFPRAEIPSEIANLLFPATLIFFSDRKFLFSNQCQVVRKKLRTFSWTTFQCKNKF